MRQWKWFLGLWFLLFVMSCAEKEYVYPCLHTEFIDAKTNSGGVLSMLIADNGQRWRVESREGLSGLTPDSLYRIVAVYEPLADSGEVRLYSASLVMANRPVKVGQIEGGIKTDPVDIQSIWLSGSYLNLILKVKVKETPHLFHFVEEGVVQEGNIRTLNLRLHHDRCGDYEAFEKKVYLSVPLRYYQEELGAGDKIRFSLNTYEEGETDRIFERW